MPPLANLITDKRSLTNQKLAQYKSEYNSEILKNESLSFEPFRGSTVIQAKIISIYLYQIIINNYGFINRFNFYIRQFKNFEMKESSKKEIKKLKETKTPCSALIRIL